MLRRLNWIDQVRKERYWDDSNLVKQRYLSRHSSSFDCREKGYNLCSMINRIQNDNGNI